TIFSVKAVISGSPFNQSFLLFIGAEVGYTVCPKCPFCPLVGEN
ncbi:unnamed protein product, partial [Arabidopsis halleri]